MTKKITRIENGIHLSRTLRTAAYCRVSTDYDDQLQSLTAQRTHYEQYIEANPLWSFAGVYYDEGISGTKKDKRPALLELIRDCEDGKIDLVLTKSVSRFARNTTDCLELVRKLSAIGVNILFEQENINTGDMEGELLLTILSSMAEQESISISRNCRWSVKKRFEEGRFIVASPPYGYRNIGGEMVIDEDEAVIVRRIFSDYLAGKSAYIIAKELIDSGTPTRRGGRWHSNTVTGILKNEKYIGDAVFQKTWTDSDFNRHLNHGDADRYLIKDHHEPIISREKFAAVQELMEHHLIEKGITRDQNKYTVRYLFTGKIVCGNCGRAFKRRLCKRGGSRYPSWVCGNHIDNRKMCSMKAVRQDQIEVAFTTMMNKLIFAGEDIIGHLLKDLSQADHPDIRSRIQKLEEDIKSNEDDRERLLGFVQKGLVDAELINAENNDLLKEYTIMCEERDQLDRFIRSETAYVRAANELLKYIKKSEPRTMFDETAFIRFVDHITVISHHELSFTLNCGLTLKEKI